MHVDNQLLSHPSPPLSLKNHNLGKAPCRCPQHLSTDAVDSVVTLPGHENQARWCGKGNSKSEKRALEGRLQPHRAKHWGTRRRVGRQDRASQTILLTKVP
jgi:hypothetical protein